MRKLVMMVVNRLMVGVGKGIMVLGGMFVMLKVSVSGSVIKLMVMLVMLLVMMCWWVSLLLNNFRLCG